MKIQRSKEPLLFLSKQEKIEVVQAIQQAELKTSGEIRVHLERKIEGKPLTHGKEIFEKIGMVRTKERNGVLILIGVHSHRLVILGDTGIDEAVPEGFWDEVIALMIGHFKEDRFGEGLVAGIKTIGEKLCEFFPFERDDLNELPDELSYSR